MITAASQPVRIDGKAFAARMISRLGTEVAAAVAKTGHMPGLAVVLVGEDPASQVYVRAKHRATVTDGMQSFEHRLPSDASETSLLKLISDLNADPAVSGILVQLPRPSHLDSTIVIGAIDPAKDVDGFRLINAGRLATGQDALAPRTPLECLMLLQDHLGDLSGLHAVVVGRSNIVGKPMGSRLVGDVAFEDTAQAAAITPVPGGVGPMTIACHLQNTLTAFRRQHGVMA